ncbi:ribitol-5-phosphate xylosyltransferase 1-like [Argopecten irradians]|uniref:ribitol-5-phosphate xylosyltransferase 1-like n=1 Tax=Argopecten irradians TaxID=31199 RepID=UPI00371C34DF
MRLYFRNWRKIAFGILGIYFIVSCYTGYLLIRRRLLSKSRYDLQRIRELTAFTDDDSDWNPWGEEFEKEDIRAPKQLPHAPRELETNFKSYKEPDAGRPNVSASTDLVVEIWGKAAIGLYLWEHIFDGALEKRLQGIWSYGEKTIGKIKFRFRTGPGVVPTKAPKYAQNVVLVLNGREPAKIAFAKTWLDYLPSLPNLQNAAVVLLGNEQCDNDWLKPYMERHNGLVKLAFITYDSSEIDNKYFYQWPLGVATYREFPKVKGNNVPVMNSRQYLCNFLGTIYKNSTRETLAQSLTSSSLGNSCFVKARHTWLPNESIDSRDTYLRALAQSDLTLNPVGVNTECYRIYEAMSYGSIPVIEDVMTPGQCGSSPTSSSVPLRLLKEENAPVIFIKDWRELKDLLDRESTLSLEYKAKRRKELILWYENFKLKMRDKFVKVLEERFFHIYR